MKINRDPRDVLHFSAGNIPNTPILVIAERVGNISQYDSCIGLRFYSNEGSIFLREDVLAATCTWAQEKTPKPKAESKPWTEKLQDNVHTWVIERGQFIVDFTLNVIAIRQETVDDLRDQLHKLRHGLDLSQWEGKTEEFVLGPGLGKMRCYRFVNTTNSEMQNRYEELKRGGLKPAG